SAANVRCQSGANFWFCAQARNAKSLNLLGARGALRPERGGMKHRYTRAGVRRYPLHLLAATRALAGATLIMAALAVTAEPASADFRLCNNTGNRVGIAVGYKENEGWTTEGWWNISAAAARPCCAARSSPASTTSTRSTTIAAANGPAKPSCARGKRSSPSAEPKIASRAAMTAPASSRSIPATSRPGPCSSPNRPTKRPCNPCNRPSRCFRPLLLPAGRARRRRRRETATDATSAPDQDRRDPRPRLLRPTRHRQPVRGRRRRLPHQYESHHACAHA